MSMYVLFVNSLVDDEFESEFLEFAAVSFAKIVRSRGHSLSLSADSATTVAIALALSEYYQPKPMESADEHPQTLFVNTPFDSHNGDYVEQAFVRDSIQPGRDQGDFLSTLLLLASGLSNKADGEAHPFVEINRILEKSLIESVVTIGELAPVQAALAKALATPVSHYTLPRLEAMRSNDLRSLLDKSQLEYDWYRETGRGDDRNLWRDEEQAREVQLSQEKARVHIAIEMLVDSKR